MRICRHYAQEQDLKFNIGKAKIFRKAIMNNDKDLISIRLQDYPEDYIEILEEGIFKGKCLCLMCSEVFQIDVIHRHFVEEVNK